MPISPAEMIPEVLERGATESSAAKNIASVPTPHIERFRRRSQVELTWVEPAPIAPLSSSVVVLTPPRAPREPSPSVIVLPDPVASFRAEPFLRRVSEGASYTIFWLEEPKDLLKEKEDAYTKVF